MSNLFYKNPLTPVQVSSTYTVGRNKPFGTNFSVLGIGGYMEVFNLSNLAFTIPAGQTGNIEISANTIPIHFKKGTGSAFSFDVLTLNSDNISSGRRRLGMLVYVYETNKIYQYTIENYDALWSAATGATGPGGSTVVISDFGTTVKNNTIAGQNFINSWTASTIEGVDGYTNLNATWRELKTGGGSGGTDTYVTGFTLSSNTLTLTQNRSDQYSAFTISLSAYTGSSSTLGAFLPLSGGTVTGNTIFQSGLTANTLNVTGNTLLSGLTATTISATTYYNLPVTADTFITGFTLSSNTITLSQNRLDQYSSFTISLSAYTGSSSTLGAYLPLSGGTVTGNTIFNSGLTANTLNVTGNTLLSGLTAVTISATTYQNLPVTADTFVTGFTLTANTITLSQNRTDGYSSFTISLSAYTGNTSVSGNYLPLSGGTVTGDTIFQSGLTANTLNVTGNTLLSGLTATTISSTTFMGRYAHFGTGTPSPYLRGIHNVEITASGSTIPLVLIGGAGGTEIWIDDTPTKAIWFGASTPGSTSDGNIHFSTYISGQSWQDRIVVDNATGNVGVNVSNPTNKLHVSASSNPLRLVGLTAGTADTNLLSVDGNGVVHTYPLSGLTGNTSTSGAYLPLSGGTVTGNTIFQSGLTANTLNVTGNTLLSGLTATTISATTYYNLPVTADTFVTGFTLSSNTITLTQNRTDSYSSFTISLSAYTGSSSTSGAYLPLSGGTVTGGTIFQSGVTANTISATTYQNLPTDIRVTGGTYTNGTITFTNNTGGTFNVTGLSTGGGGGQVFYLNLSQSKGSNRYLSTTASTASQQTSGVTIASNATSSIASFQSDQLGLTLIPGGIWSFYLHSYKENSNASFDIFVEVYKITSGSSQTLLFQTDPAAVTTNSPNPSMQLTDGYYSGTTLDVTDSIIATVRATNTGNQSHVITLVTEGTQYYSYGISTLPTQQGLTCDTLSGCSIIQTIQTNISNKFDKSGGTVSGATSFTNGLTANTISATTYQNIPSQSGTGISAFAYNGSTGILTITKNDTTTLTAGTFTYFSASSQSGNVLTLTKNGATTSTYTPNAATGGTYSNGVITLAGSGTLSTITGLGGSGGGGQVYFLNLSNTQTPYQEFSPVATTATQQTTGTSISSGITSTLASFLSPVGYPSVNLLPAGIWSFYLHTYKTNVGDSFTTYAQVYKRTSGVTGTETLLFSTDPATVDGVNPTPRMALTDVYYSGTSLDLTDRILVVIKGTNNGTSTSTLTLVTEGSLYYSYATTTFGGGTPIYTTGGTYNNSTGILTFTRTDGNTYTAGTFSYLTATTLSSANVLSQTLNGGSSTTVGTINAVTGGTYSSGTITLSGTGSVNGNTITGLNTGTVTSITSGTGMSFSNITTSGSVSIDTTKVPYYSGGFSTGFAKYNGSSWVFDNSTYLTNAVTATTLSAANVLSVTSSNGSPTTTTINAVTGGTYSNGTITLSGTGSVNGTQITGLSTGSTGGAGITWNNSTTATTATTNNGYVGTATTLTTITLPTGATFGSVIEVVGTGTGLWRISQNANQSIKFGVATTATGVGGYLSATSQYDCVKLLCTSADTTFVVTSAIGNIFYI